MTKKYRIEETVVHKYLANVWVESESEDEAIENSLEIFHDMDISEYCSQDDEYDYYAVGLTDSEWEEDIKGEVNVISSK